MRFLIAFILAALFAYVGFLYNQYLPWFFAGIAGALAGIAVPLRAFAAWLAGFLGVALVWMAVAYVQSNDNSGRMAEHMANVLPLKGNILLLMVASGFVGGLVGGVCALAAHYLRPVRKAS